MSDTPLPKIAIGYVHNGTVAEPTMRSLFKLRRYDDTRGRQVNQLIEASGLLIEENRNRVCHTFLDHCPDSTYLLFLDTDIVFEPEQFFKLVEAAEDGTGKKLISGLYFSYLAGGLSPIWMEYNPDGEFQSVKVLTGTVQPIAGSGMGFFLIHREVLEAMKAANPEQESWIWFGRDYHTVHGKGTHLGEDLTFSHRAKKLGYTTYGHCGVIVEHIKHRRENLETFMVANRIAGGEVIGDVTIPTMPLEGKIIHSKYMGIELQEGGTGMGVATAKDCDHV
jgi:hypothetical protein